MGKQNKKQPTTVQKTNDNGPGKQTFNQHIRDLRGRLLWFGGSFIVAAIIGFEFKDIIQGLITTQLSDLSLINLRVPDEIQSTVQISLFTGILAALPLGIYHSYKFMEPVLERGSSYALKLFFSSLVLIAAAVTFAFMVTIPLALGVMAQQGQDALNLGISTQSFMNFAISNVLLIAVLFQLPLIIIFSNSVQSLSKKKFTWLQRIVLPLIALGSWIVTPYTTFNRGFVGTLLIFVPAIIAFEVAIVWARMHSKIVAPHKAIIQRAQPLTDQIVSEPKPHDQPRRQPEPDILKFVSQGAVLETEALDPFPEEMFDAMLQDKDEYAYQDSAQAALPPSMEVFTDEPVAITNKQVIVPAEASIQRVPQPKVVVRPQPVAAVVQKPVFQAQIQSPLPATTPTPRFTASFSPSRAQLPQPIVQQQPVIRRLAYSRPITETIMPQQASTPTLRSLNAPQPTIPFRMTPIRPYDNTIEGLLPA